MGTIKKYQAGGKSSLGMKSVKDGFDKNPGVTRADIIIAAKKEAKYGKDVKKAQNGIVNPKKVSLRSSQLKRVGRLSAKNPDKAEKVAGKMVERATRRQRGKEYIQKNLSELMPKSKTGSKLKKQTTKSPKKAMGGAKMGKCRYGCK